MIDSNEEVKINILSCSKCDSSNFLICLGWIIACSECKCIICDIKWMAIKNDN